MNEPPSFEDFLRETESPPDRLALAESIDPQALARALDKRACELSFVEFVRRAWHVLEPAQPYIHNWHADMIGAHLEALAISVAGEQRPDKGDFPETRDILEELQSTYSRLVINVPPGTSKSTLVSVLFPAWVWGPFGWPAARFLCASHNVDLAERDNLKMRRLITDPWFSQHWGSTVALTDDQNAKDNFENTATGWRVAVASAAVTGRRGDFVIIDDPHSVSGGDSEATRETVVTWFREAVPTRLNNPDRSAILVIMQRLHERDVSGVILDGDLGFDAIILPMEYDPDRATSTRLGWADPRTEPGELLFPARFPAWTVEREKKILGPYSYAGQFQQSPTPRGGGVIKDSDWRLWDRPTYPEDFSFILASVDTAYGIKETNDYSAMTIWGVFSPSQASTAATRHVDRYGKSLPLGRNPEAPQGMSSVLLMYAFNERLEFNALVRRIATECKRFKVDRVLIENKASGISVGQEMRRLYANEDWAVQLVNPGNQDKLARLHSVQGIFAEGHVFAPDKVWAEMVIRQVASFPKGQYKDLVDSCLVAGTKIATRRGSIPIEQVVVGDQALTPLGWRRVTAAGPTGTKPVTTLGPITGTGNHPVFTLDEGWRPLDTVTQAKRLVGLSLCDLIQTIHRSSSTSVGTATDGWAAGGSTTSAPEPSRVSMSTSGRPVAGGRWRKAARSTTRTVTLSIAALKIWKSYRAACIGAWLRTSIAKLSGATSSASGRLLRSGTGLMQAGRGITSSRRRSWEKPVPSSSVVTRDLSLRAGAASGAASLSPAATSAPFVARTPAPSSAPATSATAARASKSGFSPLPADIAARASSPLVETSAGAAAAARSAAVVSVPVFNLTVEGAECYYANGVLVHNCSMAMRHLRECGLLVRAEDALADLDRAMDYDNVRSAAPLYAV